ncbi:sperm flagellar protein 1-like [Anthonomus grandis grandis]|uniref:sperm flagellar protein 1-like n=1 Tax=Anthonomus grandis grandis TaxID=2921223 RepID=UPI0021662105|nr:sperm flagellar protein 1-like [Anthonomus grandis grandis]
MSEFPSNIDLDELFRWIDEHEITRQKKNLNRDFSDAVPLAEILKQHFPKLVDLHNYVPRNALSQKIVNWSILNKKVLNKLKINLPFCEQEQLAKAVPGAIEKLLHKIMVKVEKQQEVKGSTEKDEKIYYLDGISNSEEHAEEILDIKIKTGAKTSSQKMVPVNIFNKMESEITEKTNEVIKLKQKIEHLESMLTIKDERITDLTRQLQTMVNGDGDSTTSPRTRFFNKIF